MILSGTKVAEKIYDEIKNTIETQGIRAKLTVILVGDNPSSLRYINQKQKWSAYVGMVFELKHFPLEVSEEALLECIEDCNQDQEVSGLIIQLPLPAHIDTNMVLRAINPEKDVDGFHPINQGKIVVGDPTGFSPCTPAGVMELFAHYMIPVEGKKCVVVGRSNIVGKPITNLLINAGATVSICNTKTPSLREFTKNADIVILCAGKPHLLSLEDLGPNTIVVDVGFTVVDGKIHGDADFDAILEAGHDISPVPKGVGALTVACLIKNTLKAARNLT